MVKNPTSCSLILILFPIFKLNIVTAVIQNNKGLVIYLAASDTLYYII